MDIQRVNAFVRTVLSQSKKLDEKLPAQAKGAEDHVQISDQARQAQAVEQFKSMVQDARTLDPTSSERIAAAQAKMEAGDYLADDVTRAIASKVKEDLY